jgi:5-methylcytosine-specific restriction enzyme A
MSDPIESLKIGAVLNNETLCEIFSCSPQGGMRRSHTTNTLVIVSNHIKTIYDDRWINDVFHYTGMGTKGNQNLNFAQNKTLTESAINGVNIHLFEVFKEREYTYIGKVKLSSPPYFEKQPDESGIIRDACVFPLKLKDGLLPAIRLEDVQKPFDLKVKKARSLSDEEVKRRARNSKKSAGSRPILSQQFDRDPWVAEHAKRDAKGRCQLCEAPAPFLNEFNEPYLETHHIEWLAKGGEDTIDNTVALCPNCHRKMHVLKDERDIRYLKDKKLRVV